MNFSLKIWRQKNPGEAGRFETYEANDINKHMSVFFDAINLTGANMLQYGRYSEQFYSASEGFARYQLGVRMAL